MVAAADTTQVADMTQELVEAVVELVELVADVTMPVFVTVVAAGLAARNGQG